jgi:hypothetical protein
VLPEHGVGGAAAHRVDGLRKPAFWRQPGTAVLTPRNCRMPGRARFARACFSGARGPAVKVLHCHRVCHAASCGA